MHIVRVRHLFYPDMPKDYFYELSMRQAEKGHDVDVLTWNKDRCYPSEIFDDGFVVHRLPGLNLNLGGILQDYPYLPRLPVEIVRLKPEIIHTESHLFLTTVQTIRKAKKMRIPCVVTVHGVFAERGFALNFAQYAYLRTLGLEVFKSADRVISLTYSDAQDIIKLGCSTEKIRLIPNAVDAEFFKPCKERENNLIVWVGRFVPEKGLDCLIEAARIVADKFNGVEFLLIGYGPLKPKIMKLAHDRDLLGKVVRFAGSLSREKIAEVLGRATVFAFPSLKEGLPVSVLEAMSCGLPVVGSDVTGVNEVISNQKNGLLVRPKKPEELAIVILRLLNDGNLREQLGQNARQLITVKYNWDKNIEKIRQVYNEAINETN